MSCGVGHRHGPDPMLLWLWCQPAATAPIGHQAWESLYARGAAIKRFKKKKKKETKKIAFGYLEFHTNFRIFFLFL